MKDRAERQLDFELRARDGRDVEVYCDTKYVRINPFSDEDELLESIEARSEQCTKVDAYWSIPEDVVFVQVIAFDRKWLAMGRYRRWAKYGLNLVSVVPEPTISRAVFDRELAFWLDSGRALDGLRTGPELGDRLSPVE